MNTWVVPFAPPGRTVDGRRSAAGLRRAAPVLPVVLLVALVAVPPAGGTEGADGAGGSLADVVSAVVVAGCAILLLREGRRPLTRIAALVLGLPVVGVSVAALGADGASALTGTARYLQIFVLVPAAVLLLVRDVRQFRLLAWAFVVLAVFEGGLGVHQYLTGTGASYRGEDVRAVGTFGAGDVMGMATVVAFGIICCAGLALGASTRGDTDAAVKSARDRGTSYATAVHLRGIPVPPAAAARGLALGTGVLLLVPLALSFSRGAWIATAAALALQLLMAGVRRAITVFAVLAATGVVLVAGAGVGSQLLNERVGSITQVTAGAPDQSVTDRYTMWDAALGMWREQPLTGVGLKQFPAERDSHASLALSAGSDVGGAGGEFHRQELLSPHNMYLLVLAEQGLLGLTALAGSWAVLLVCGIRRAECRGRRAPDCALIACGLLVWQLTDFVYADIGGPSTVLTAVVLGLAAWWALADRTPEAGAA